MQATGIQIDGQTLRFASVKKGFRGLRIGALGSSAYSNVKPIDIGPKPFVSGLASNEILLRSSPTHAFGRKSRQALTLQTEAQLHLNPDELIILSRIHSKDKWAELFSTTKSAVDQHLSEFRRLNIDPERVGSIGAGLQAFVQWKAPEIHTYFLVDIGWKTTHCLWIEQGKIQKAHAVGYGLQNLKEAWLEDRKKTISLSVAEIDFNALKAGHSPQLAEEARALRREIAKLLHSFQCQRALIFTGESEGLKDFFLELLRDFILEEINIGLTLEEQRYASCIGLAIDYLENQREPLQFRTAASLSPSSWEALGRYAASLLTMFFLLAIGIYLVGSRWLDQREKEIAHGLELWTASRDPTIRLELFREGGNSEDLVNRWLKLIEKNSKNYPFILRAPLVSEFLDWITRHPLIASFRLAQDPISFERIQYKLGSMPRLENEMEPYQAKVEIDFKIASPLHARQLHQSLMSEENLIDTSQEITWEYFDDLYRTSFYLRNDYGHF